MAAVPGSTSQVFESERENLMKHLLDAVKQCQVHFGGKQELATEKDSCVQCLLAQFENAFLHGLKKGKVWGAISSLSEPFRHVTGKVLSGIPDAEITFWPFLKEHMSPSDIQRYFSISSINTDSGRCRSWLRSCLNETSLERVLVSILADWNTIRQFYDDWALFLDEERSSTLPMMARGLGSILFAIDIESSQLNSPFKQTSLPRANVVLAPVENKKKSDPLPVIPDKATNHGDPSIINKKKRKKKVKQATIEEIEVPEDEPPSGMYKKPEPQSANKQIEDLTVNKPVAKRGALNDTGKSVSVAKPSEREGSSIKSHRRATSLESSEIIRKKQDLYGLASSNAVDFEVPSFGLARNEKAKSEETGRKINISSKKADQKELERKSDNSVFEMDEEIDSKENPEYTNILSKLANLGTSFKSSFSTGFFQRDQGTREDDIDERNARQQVIDQDDCKSLIDDENDVFNRTTKLEMRQDTDDSLTSKWNTNYPDTFNEEKGLDENSVRSRTSSANFERMLQRGDALSPNESRLEKLESAMKLKTPPPTPADSAVEPERNGALSPNDMDLSSAGFKTKLNQLEKEALAESEVEGILPSAKDESSEEIGDSDMLNSGILNDFIKQDDTDRLSVNSSTTSSVLDDSDTLQPLGFESERFTSMVMSYDRQSSQAANDTLQLLKTSAEVNFSQDGEREKDSMYERASKQHIEGKMVGTNYESDLSKEELKQVILTTVKRKDELEEKSRVLQLAVDEERELSLSLKSEVELLSEKLQELQETSEKRITEFTRENEVLRNQLKKYVAAVQLLKRDNKNVSKETNDAISTLRGYSDVSEVVLPPQPKERTDSEMDSVYEEKLVQMAQLHGELMEFHEMLQRDLVKKDKIITKMKEELVVLRGPLPDEIGGSNQDDERNVCQHRPLINIWIPSVFIKGKGSDAHHLYQIYIRIGDEEWNIYRRYSQFHKMHMTCCKTFQDVEKLHFPPKKLIGKKDIKFVEGRRKKLQDYIRKLINVSLANDTSLSDLPSKENLEKSLPFFSDEFCYDGKRKKEDTKKKSKKPAVYTGL